MKKYCYLFSFLTMLMFFSCSSDDENSSDINLTTDEIVALLNGKWVVGGEFREIITESGESFDGRYKGTIEFKGERYTFDVTEGEKYNADNYSRYLEETLVGTNGKYSILKKDGKNYINFGSTRDCSFEIVSLNKNSFKLVLDTDNVIIIKEGMILVKNNGGHIYMTMSSN